MSLESTLDQSVFESYQQHEHQSRHQGKPISAIRESLQKLNHPAEAEFKRQMAQHLSQWLNEASPIQILVEQKVESFREEVRQEIGEVRHLVRAICEKLQIPGITHINNQDTSIIQHEEAGNRQIQSIAMFETSYNLGSKSNVDIPSNRNNETAPQNLQQVTSGFIRSLDSANMDSNRLIEQENKRDDDKYTLTKVYQKKPKRTEALSDKQLADRQEQYMRIQQKEIEEWKKYKNEVNPKEHKQIETKQPLSKEEERKQRDKNKIQEYQRKEEERKQRKQNKFQEYLRKEQERKQSKQNRQKKRKNQSGQVAIMGLQDEPLKQQDQKAGENKL